MKEYCDIYLGYEIDYNPNHEGFFVFKGGCKVHESNSYDGACEWIGTQRALTFKENKPS